MLSLNYVIKHAKPIRGKQKSIGEIPEINLKYWGITNPPKKKKRG